MEQLIDETNEEGVEEDEASTKNVSIWLDQLTEAHNQPQLPPSQKNRAEISLGHQKRQLENQQHQWYARNVQDLPKIVQEQPRSQLYQRKYWEYVSSSSVEEKDTHRQLNSKKIENLFPPFFEEFAYILATKDFLNNLILGFTNDNIDGSNFPFQESNIQYIGVAREN